MSIITILFAIFLTLKLCGVIAWSWWWVTAPLWGCVLICALIYAVVAMWAGILVIHTKWRR